MRQLLNPYLNNFKLLKFLFLISCVGTSCYSYNPLYKQASNSSLNPKLGNYRVSFESEVDSELQYLKEDLENAPDNLDIVFKITDTHFANNNFDSCFNMLLKYYPKNKDKIKTKILEYFNVLGFAHESTILYRKKLSTIMFS